MGGKREVMTCLHLYIYAFFGYRTCIKILITINASYIRDLEVVLGIFR